MLYEVRSFLDGKSWGQAFEIFDHNNKSILKTYYLRTDFFSNKYFLETVIEGFTFQILPKGFFWVSKYIIYYKNNIIGEIIYIDNFFHLNPEAYKILLKGKEYLFNAQKRTEHVLTDQSQQPLFRVNIESNILKPNIFTIERNTEINNESINFLLVITYYLSRKIYGHASNVK